jgi:hypothetical protein
MTYRPEREKAGYCAVWYSDQSVRYIARSQFDQISAALASPDQRVFHGTSLYGGDVTIRLANVTDVEDISPDIVKAIDEGAEEAKHYKRAHGEDDE